MAASNRIDFRRRFLISPKSRQNKRRRVANPMLQTERAVFSYLIQVFNLYSMFYAANYIIF